MDGNDHAVDLIQLHLFSWLIELIWRPLPQATAKIFVNPFFKNVRSHIIEEDTFQPWKTEVVRNDRLYLGIRKSQFSLICVYATLSAIIGRNVLWLARSVFWLQLWNCLHFHRKPSKASFNKQRNWHSVCFILSQFPKNLLIRPTTYQATCPPPNSHYSTHLPKLG